MWPTADGAVRGREPITEEGSHRIEVPVGSWTSHSRSLLVGRRGEMQRLQLATSGASGG